MKTTINCDLKLDKKQFEKYTDFLAWLKQDRTKTHTEFAVPGTVFTTAMVRFNIELKEVEKPVPEAEKESFIEWILSLPIMNGTGNYKEYYSYTSYYQDDIGVMVKITGKE